MKSAWFALSVLAVTVPLGCNPFETDQSVILAVSKLDAPATASASAPFTVTLTVTTGGCTTFDRIEVQRLTSGARLIPWGTDASVGHRDIACPSVIFDTPHSIQFEPPFANPFQLYVEQGTLAPLMATVQVQ